MRDERAHEKWGKDKKREGGGEAVTEREGKEGTTDNPLFKNLCSRWQPQYSDWPVLAFLSTGPRFKIETTTIFSMLDLENLPQKKLGCLAVNKKLTDLLNTPGLVPMVSAKAKYILALYFYLSVEEHDYN